MDGGGDVCVGGNRKGFVGLAITGPSAEGFGGEVSV